MNIPSTSIFLAKDYLKISKVASRFLCTSYEFLEVYNSPCKILTWLWGFLIDFLYLVYVYWWCVTTQIWVVLLIGCDTTWVWNFLARFWDAILRGNQWCHRQMSAVFSCLLEKAVQWENCVEYCCTKSSCTFCLQCFCTWVINVYYSMIFMTNVAAPWVLQRMYIATPPLPGSHLTCFHQGIVPFPKQSGFPSLLVWCLCRISDSKVFDLMTSFVLVFPKMKE